MAKRKGSPKWLPWLIILVLMGGAVFFFYNKMTGGRSLRVGEVAERCYPLKAGETIRYTFSGEDMVSFDIRRGGDGMFPPRLVPMDAGEFTAPTTDDYCLRFGNPLEREQKIQYSVVRVKQ